MPCNLINFHVVAEEEQLPLSRFKGTVGEQIKSVLGSHSMNPACSVY